MRQFGEKTEIILDRRFVLFAYELPGVISIETCCPETLSPGRCGEILFLERLLNFFHRISKHMSEFFHARYFEILIYFD
jgi:hypothetical protein